MQKIIKHLSWTSVRGCLSNAFSLGLLLCGLTTMAQGLSNYSFNTTMGTYTALGGGAQQHLVTTTTQDLDEFTSFSIPLPFTFPFDGGNYNEIYVNPNGFFSFGNGVSNVYDSPISSTFTNALSGVISVFGIDLMGFYNEEEIENSTIKSKLVDDTFIIECNNFRSYLHSDVDNCVIVSYQLHLEADGRIKFLYKSSYNGVPAVRNIQVGLKAGAGNFKTRHAYGQGSSWEFTEPGNIGSLIRLEAPQTLPNTGLTYTWMPPAGCVTPSAQPTNLQLTSNETGVSGWFTTVNSGVDTYLVLRNLSGVVPNDPQDGTVYTTGVNAALNSYVVYNGIQNTFEDNTDINGNTTYDYRVYAVASSCSGGPKYRLVSPLMGSITNCPKVFNADIVGTTTNSIVFSFVQNNGTVDTITRQLEVATDGSFQNQVVGSPFTINGTDTSYTVSELEANTTYYYRGKNSTTTCQDVAYSATKNVKTACEAISEFSENFDQETGFSLPSCWSAIIEGDSTMFDAHIELTTESDFRFSAPRGVRLNKGNMNLQDANQKLILVTPSLSNVGAGTHRLRFMAKKSSSITDTEIEIVALNSNIPGASVEVVHTVPAESLSTNWTPIVVNFDNYLNSSYNYIGIRRVGDSSFTYAVLAIDDVVWEPIPACADMPQLTSSNITINSATVSWPSLPVAPQNGFEYVVSTQDAFPSDAAEVQTTQDNIITLTGLNASTDYFVYIRTSCSDIEKGVWKKINVKTVYVENVPWIEEFQTEYVTPQGWRRNIEGISTTPMLISTSRGATGFGATSVNATANIYASSPKAALSTPVIGPLNSANYEFRFYYKHSNYYSPYAPLENWGNITVEVSTDFGTTWTNIGTIDNEQGTGNYIPKVYNLATYQGEYVQFRLIATHTHGDYDISFDKFEVKELESDNPISLSIMTPSTTEILGIGNVLQLNATVENTTNTAVTWTSSDTSVATISATGEVVSVSVGTTTIRATSVEDPTKFDEIEIVVKMPIYVSVSTNPEGASTTLTTAGAELTLVATVTNASNTAVTWSSTNEAVATVSVDGVVTAVGDGTAVIRATSVEDPTKYEEISVEVSIAASSSSFRVESVVLYPNPTVDIVNISTEMEIERIEVYNTLGQKIGETQNKMFDLSGKSSGVYFVKVYVNGAHHTYKIVKK